ncbi:hypothetical protein JYJ95_12450 [Corallococcus exiguus]|nr:hypothetical protein [Corallococcus exiguus]MBN8467327.1 hypothetical protein [Corallococcus exiguus]
MSDAKQPKAQGKRKDSKRGITASVGRDGVISKVHLGKNYDEVSINVIVA